MTEYNRSKQPLLHGFNPRIPPPNTAAYLALNYDANLYRELSDNCGDVPGDYRTEPPDDESTTQHTKPDAVHGSTGRISPPEIYDDMVISLPFSAADSSQLELSPVPESTSSMASTVTVPEVVERSLNNVELDMTGRKAEIGADLGGIVKMTESVMTEEEWVESVTDDAVLSNHVDSLTDSGETASSSSSLSSTPLSSGMSSPSPAKPIRTKEVRSLYDDPLESLKQLIQKVRQRTTQEIEADCQLEVDDPDSSSCCSSESSLRPGSPESTSSRQS